MLEQMLPRDFPDGRLRQLRLSDLDAFQAYRAIPELGRYQGWSVMTASEAVRFLNDMSQSASFSPGNWLQLGIAEPKSDRLVGDIGLYLSDDETTGEVGFTLHPSSQGRGIASQAVRQALALFFALTTASRVLGIVDSRNLSSIRLLERLGFRCIDVRQVSSRSETCQEREYELLRFNHLGLETIQGRDRG